MAVGEGVAVGVFVGVGVGLESSPRGDADASSHAHRRMAKPMHNRTNDAETRGAKSHTAEGGYPVRLSNDDVIGTY